MNLFRILMTHYAPKDSATGTESYVICENESKFYDYFKEQDFDWIEDYECYFDKEELEEKSWKERVIEGRGYSEMELDIYNDLYYGLTAYDWEIVAEDINVDDFKKAIELGIIKEIK